MLSYPAKVVPDTVGFRVSFPDIPEALTAGESREEAIKMASDALLTAMDFYFEDRREVPQPSAPKRGQVMVDLPASVAAKVLLLNELIRQGKKNADLARAMHASPQEISRLTDLKHATKIDAISDALRILGKRLELSVA